MIKRILIICLMAVVAVTSVAQSSKKVKDLQKQRKEALQSIAKTDKELKTTKKSALQSLHQLNKLTAEITKHKEVIAALNAEISNINKQERKINETISRLEKDLNAKKEAYAKAIRGIAGRNSGYETLMFVFSSNSLNQSYRRIRYLREYSAWRKKEAIKISEQQAELEKKKAELAKTRSEKNAMLGKRTDAANKLKQKEESQKEVVADLKKKEKELQKELNAQRKQAAALNRRIEQLIAEEARKAAEEARRAAEAAKKATNADKKSGKNASAGEVRKSQTKGGYAMTKDELELSNSFSQNKGRLPMPLSGKYMIVGHFGQQQHQELKYVQVNSSGIDIQTTPGTTARSVFNGVVTRVFVMPGYNSSVIIRHGNYLTIYSNLSEVFVKAGDKVTTRQSIGRIYSDPEENNRTVLHFQLWKETTKLNPEPWLNK
ncbi:peptidase M24 [Tannerella sp. AM09-19]|jgi:septal ring factor EnvC (AmiA/AmiB activator)|uniref:murein hydrolase activator EnvC family protein n=1 Tax=Coprobacter fastidiosus TaxID=1099853 RepID=UPI000EFF8040|nr:peptidoglycan DD-metalloendopeptidase family protein [Coprobacter fastidiosus]RHO60818.1 peptidase M24 [Tannerella sp. AM09-19]